MTPSERDALLLHAVYAVTASLLLLLPGGDTGVGWRVFALVVLYNLALPAFALARGHRAWLRLWLFLVPLSAFQILPDYFLADVLGVLVFPDLGFPQIGPVSAFMAGMWTIPLWIVVFTGWSVASRASRGVALAVVALLSFALFVGSEATLTRIPVWYARDVALIGRVAVYVVVPEVLLGLVAYLAYDAVERRSTYLRLVAACAVPVFYLGSLATSYLVVERLL